MDCTPSVRHALVQTGWLASGCTGVSIWWIFGGMTPVSDGGLSRWATEVTLMLPGETESGSAGTQPDKG